MPFLLGDDNGNVKRVQCVKTSEGEVKLSAGEDLVGGSKGKQRAIQVMTLPAEHKMLAVSRSDGTSSLYSQDDGGSFPSVLEWNEPRFKTANNHRHVGLDILESSIYTCTSSGHIRRTRLPSTTTAESTQAAVPTRLTSFQVSKSGVHFAYGGDEVELSVWDVSRAFSAEKIVTSEPTQGTKRKDKTDLFPAETWRAKNLPNDSLNLRQPVHIISLTYLRDPNERQLAIGTYNGAIRRYDTRAARRPVNNWEKVVRDGQGSVAVLQNGQHEHELFLSSSQSTVSCLDLRNGRLLYTYKGISGAVNSLAPTPTHLVSTSLDRLVRLHSTASIPEEAGSARKEGVKPAVLDKLFWKFTPTVVRWDGQMDPGLTSSGVGEGAGVNDEDDDVWNDLAVASEDEGDGEDPRSKAKRRKRA